MKLLKAAISSLQQNGPIKFSKSVYKFSKWRLFEVGWRIYLTYAAVSAPQITNNNKIWISDDSKNEVTYPKLTNNKTSPFASRYPINSSIDPRYVCELSKCKLIGALAIPICDGYLILDPIGGTYSSFLDSKKHVEMSDYFENRTNPLQAVLASFVTWLPMKGKERSDSPICVFPMVNIHKSYYHWIVDQLPKLRMVELYKKETGINPKILVRSDSPAYCFETLSLLGYSNKQIIEWENNTLDVDRLITTQHKNNYTDHLPEDYQWLRNKLLPQKRGKSENTAKRLYVSRQHINNERRVLNFRELKTVIKSKGFEVVVAESLSISDQIQLFNEADVIMGPHGGGLTNMMFSEDPKIVELLPESKTIPVYKDLADVLEFEYYPVVNESDRDNNLIVDVSDILATLDDVLDN